MKRVSASDLLAIYNAGQDLIGEGKGSVPPPVFPRVSNVSHELSTQLRTVIVGEK